MAVELRFRKADATPWGFRLTGGADYEAPLTVVKVAENTLAEDAGMQVGDVILRINDIATKKLTHAQAHDIILKAGNEFILGVRRGGLLNLSRRVSSETSAADNDTVTKTKTESGTKTEKEDQDLNITDEEIADIIGEPLQNPHLDETNQESEVLQAVTAEDAENKLKAKKWSTFLQKPKNPIPKPRRPIEEGPKGPPYRVIIKKQPKKIPGTCDEPIADKTSEERKPELEPESEEEREEEEDEENEQKEEDPHQSDGDLEKEDGESPRQSPNQSDAEEDEDLQSPPQFHEDDEQDSSLKESDMRRMSASLEEQLVQVQKQLLALSKLPSAIQSTLNAVTQQLELIVSITQHEEEEVVQVVEEEGAEEVYEEKALSTLDEEEASELAESPFEEARRKDEEEVCSESTEDFMREEQRQIMTEEELEAQREEQERLEKREKVNHWNHIWPWSDVAKPVYRINFLKYQPPPKNMDHLQRSDVYRMIHDMEPPVRGIKARETKVLAEQDYYAKKEDSVASLSPQMER